MPSIAQVSTTEYKAGALALGHSLLIIFKPRNDAAAVYLLCRHGILESLAAKLPYKAAKRQRVLARITPLLAHFHRTQLVFYRAGLANSLNLFNFAVHN